MNITVNTEQLLGFLANHLPQPVMIGLAVIILGTALWRCREATTAAHSRQPKEVRAAFDFTYQSVKEHIVIDHPDGRRCERSCSSQAIRISTSIETRTTRNSNGDGSRGMRQARVVPHNAQ
ncbi:hypothetical protein DDD63_11595 [Actinobaculum sp. 313]|nr:hypothetical protein DDD63_11595 [Actinobaculum sp. 313]